MATITTLSYCAFNATTGKAVAGSKEEIVNALFTWSLDHRKIVATIKGFKQVSLNSYSDEWTAEDMRKDTIGVLFSTLSQYGFKIYRDIM